MSSFTTALVALAALSIQTTNLYAQTDTCESSLQTTAVAQSPLTVTPEGTFEVRIDYSTETPGERVVTLPAMLSTLSEVPDLRVVVLAGNSGTEYENTRHNLAFAFGEYLITKYRPRTHTSRTDFVSREEVAVRYDDGTARSWVSDFITEPNQFRTASGEVFFVPSLNGAPVLIVKAIGDYNEVGDFAVPIVDGLRVPSERVLIVHDDLQIPEGTARLDAGGPQKFAGNNAVLSMIRNLSYQMFETLADELAAMVPTGFAEADRQTARAAYRKLADVRYQNHLGDPQLYHAALKNVDSIRAALGTLIKVARDAGAARPSTEMTELRRQKSEGSRELGPISKQLADPNTSPAERARLTEMRDHILSAVAPLGARIKALDQDLVALDTGIKARVTDVITRRLSFARLSLGSDDGSLERGASKIEFVMGPYPRDVFTPDVWDRAARTLADWAGRPAGSVTK